MGEGEGEGGEGKVDKHGGDDGDNEESNVNDKSEM